MHIGTTLQGIWDFEYPILVKSLAKTKKFIQIGVSRFKSPIDQWDNWHERAAFQRSAFGQSTAGNDIVATIFIHLFYPPPCFFLRRDLFSLKECSDQKTYLAKVG